MTLGSLVRCTDNALGIGKLTAVNNPYGIVEYFSSIGQRISQNFPISSLRRIRLGRQTRCYIYFEDTETWQIGRIYNWDEEKQQYIIDLPDQRSILASESQIYVRYNLPLEDPMDILGMKGQETPYFHNKRHPFLKTIIEQRAVSRGMTGLLSANINLYPHQVEIIRRVLEDPIQRYLLADEVGLGKTIEAGVILRQFLLDEPTQNALILVPPHLYYQWKQELTEKFYLSEFGDRVTIISIDESNSLQNLFNNYNLLIIDEAHHIANMAIATDQKKRDYFQNCRKLAHQVERLLLLSATPVLNHEQDFLTMLHLLDPTTYQLDDLDGFRERVQKRQEIGRFLLTFKEGIPPFVLKTNIKKLKTLFSEDTPLLTLTNDLEQDLQNEDNEQINQQITKIRTHISDTHRLHRRMLRNRRSTVEDVIFERNAVPKLEYDLDERVYSLHELLDEWRIIAPDTSECHRIFALLFTANNTWLGILKQIIEARLNLNNDDNLIEEIGNDNYKILTKTAYFENEINILESILNILSNPSEDGDRLELLKIVILYHLAEVLKLQSFKSNLDQLQIRIKQRIERPFAEDKFPKLLIFSSFTQSCDVIVNYLAGIFGEQSVVSHQKGESKEILESNLNKFTNHNSCFILVTDRTGEEGKNLQFVDGIIHFDLPFSPNRLEQRLGRIDRIGGKMQIKSWLLVGSDLTDSFSGVWYELLHHGFNIFKQSIASLQFYIDDKIQQFEKVFFQSGANGLREMINQIKNEIEVENVKISEQNALDEIDARSQLAIDYFAQLEDYDDQHHIMEKATEGWLCNVLNFQRYYDNNLKDVRHYRATGKTLVTTKDLEAYFAESTKYKGIYNRRLANKYREVHLYRLGEKLIDTLVNYMNWDDRGKAFAMWRYEDTWDQEEGSEWLGFRFDYIVEIDWQKIQAVIEDFQPDQYNLQALKRQTDALFPPQIKTLFLDRYCQIVEDEAILKILQRPYNGKNSNNRDYNLAKKRLEIIDEFISPGKWSQFCLEARKTSKTLLLESSDFIEYCQKMTEIAKITLTNRLNQLQSRYHRFPHLKLEKEIKLATVLDEALLQGIIHPHLHLDAVGFLIISGRNPFASSTDNQLYLDDEI